MEAKENFTYEWTLGEHIDCLDTINKWCDAVVTKVCIIIKI